MLFKQRSMAALVILLSLLCGLSACGQKTLTWQEQYDLGTKYLSEGNYQEAIIAFTAAIEIDPKLALAYVGRGDAYIGSGETEETLPAAQADYEQAIELDETNVDAYIGLADVYIRQGAYDKAIEILRRGLTKIGDNQSIANKIAEIEIEIGEESTQTNPYYHGPTEDMSTSLSYRIIESEGNMPEIANLLYEVLVVDGECFDKAERHTSTFTGEPIVMTLYGHLNIELAPFADSTPYIVRGITGGSFDEIRNEIGELCPEQYADSKYYKGAADYDKFFAKHSITSDHGGGWGSTSFLKENEWYLAVACYDSSGKRLGYAALQTTDGSEIEQIRDQFMVIINEETGALVSNEDNALW